MPTAELTSFDFARDALIHSFGEGDASQYLADYLGHLQATVALEEHHYVDRHYLDDFASYYARSFETPAAHCRRFHFFRQLTRARVDELVAEGLGGTPEERTRVERELNEGYLGFIVRRPLDGAAIGRTVLSTYPGENGRRHYEVVRPYHVNISGIRLRVDGLAYQQQDRGAAVCASSALWSALQQVAYLDGQKTPSPSAITQAAASPYPASHGLDELQMATALNSLGYIADRFVPEANFALFRAKIIACLESHLPVVLLLSTPEVSAGHAVTVTGFSEPGSAVEVTVAAETEPLRMRGGSARVLYVHDDNLGSHAHYELEDDPLYPGRLMLYRGRRNVPSDWYEPDTLEVYAALVPKPRKLRLPIESLFYILLHLRPALEDALAGTFVGAPEYRARFVTGVSYRDELFGMDLWSGERALFHRMLSLPRQIAVLSLFDGAYQMLDVVLDVTSVPRDHSPNVLAIVAPGVPALTKQRAALQNLAKRFEALIITAEPVAQSQP